MATARPLRDVFADATGDEAARASDPAELLRANGHEDLPDTLVAEAVTSYADTAPVEVAEHLSQYVMANSAVPGVGTEIDPSGWLEAVSTAPEMLQATVDPAAGLDEEPPYEPDTADATADATAEAAATGGAGVDGAYALDLDFGFGEAIEGVGEAVETIVANAADLFGAAPAPTTGEDAFGAAAGDEAFGAATAPSAADTTFGAAADLDDAGEGEDDPDGADTAGT
jgi:hypothetical protein